MGTHLFKRLKAVWVATLVAASSSQAQSYDAHLAVTPERFEELAAEPSFGLLTAQMVPAMGLTQYFLFLRRAEYLVKIGVERLNSKDSEERKYQAIVTGIVFAEYALWLCEDAEFKPNETEKQQIAFLKDAASRFKAYALKKRHKHPLVQSWLNFRLVVLQKDWADPPADRLK